MKDVTSNQLVEFFSHYTPRSYEKGERIIREYDTPAGVFFITAGVVRTHLISGEGSELTALLHTTNHIFPLRWALHDGENIYNYQALTPVTVYRAPKDDFRSFIRQHPEAMDHVLTQLVNDVSALIYRMQHIVFGDAHSKVASVVLTAAKRFSVTTKATGPGEIEVPLTHQQIADSAGITRETASLEMKKLKEEGLITYKGRSLLIVNLEGLTKAAYL
jgi:CRP/FNR family transcriptional regulator, cyclic AMP receptor protein